VNSQVFDHTSTLMFLETFFNKKTGKNIRSKQISSWRRAICGDLTSIFRPSGGAITQVPGTLKKDQVITSIQNAKNKPAHEKPNPLTKEELASLSFMPRQEKGTRKACALPYQLFAECHLTPDGMVNLQLGSGKARFGQKLVPIGAAFTVYTTNSYRNELGKTWAYAVSAGNQLSDLLTLEHFGKSLYELCVSGPNGFFRQFKGSKDDPALSVSCEYEISGILSKRLTGNVELIFENKGDQQVNLKITDAYQHTSTTLVIMAKSKIKRLMDLQNNSGWYDFTVVSTIHPEFSKHYAGHAETGEDSITDPLMG